MEIGITSIGNFSKMRAWLIKVSNLSQPKALKQLGELGVVALASATPKDSGITASSWYYEIIKTKGGWDLQFYNTGHPETRVPVALLIQYGHGTRNGGYVPPVDYINPAMRKVFGDAGNLIFEEVLK